MMYCEAVLPAAGLGNRLFPWARAVILSKRHGLRMLAPVWTQFRMGPILRGERDLRTYHNLFKRNPGHASGMERAWAKLTSLKIPENAFVPPASRASASRNAIVVCEGISTYFEPLNDSWELIRGELRAMTHDRWIKKADETGEITVGIHIRRGDAGNEQISLSWFVESLKFIRRTVQRPVTAHVASDGDSSEFKTLFDEGGITLIDTGSAIGDMLALSKSRVLLASASSFSAWAFFLGRMPLIAAPGCNFKFYGLSAANAYIGQLDPTRPDPDIVRILKPALEKNAANRKDVS